LHSLTFGGGVFSHSPTFRGGVFFLLAELNAKTHELAVNVSDGRARGLLNDRFNGGQVIMSGVLSGHRDNVVVESAVKQ
jgi:hypothetical protein